MSDGSDIEWCDATWQPVLGCTRVSPGCDHCYAISVVHRGMSAQHRGLTKVRPRDASRPGVDWNGTVRLQPEKLAEPLRWRKPRRVFVCSLADLFHDAIPFEYVAAVFGVMAACPQHTFLVLTKRPERAREFFAWLDSVDLHDAVEMQSGETWNLHGYLVAAAIMNDIGKGAPVFDHNDVWRRVVTANAPWPLPNVHLGTSVEDQQHADERIPALLQCPAALHWVSAEPLLGPVDVTRRSLVACGHCDRGSIEVEGGGATCGRCMGTGTLEGLGWVVVGGESGPGARPFDVAWARAIVGQCRDAGVLVFVKQVGRYVRDDEARRGEWALGTAFGATADGRLIVETRDRKGGDMSEWPADLRRRELPR